MAKLFTTNFKAYTIEKFISSDPMFYMFLGKHTPFPNDSIPPTPTDSVVDTYITGYGEAFAAKAIAPTDVSFMVPRNDWVSNTGYTAYRESSGTLYGNNFYVSVATNSGYSVFKCLSNNGVKSVYAPDVNATSPTDDIYQTMDGYQWKLMYSIPTATFDKFATRDFIPVFANTEVKAAAVDGAIDYIDVSYGGSNYDGYTNGTFQSVQVSGNTRVYVIDASASSNANFYIGSAIKITSGTGDGQLRVITDYQVSGSTRTIVVDQPFSPAPTTTSTYDISPHVVVTGGGTGFQGRALVNAAASNSIYRVDVVNRGSGYYYGSAVAVGNTGGLTNTAVLSIVVGPKGGHGYDPVKELGSKYLCMTTTFDTTDVTANTKVIDANEFRRVGVLVNPLLANVHLSYTGATNIFTLGDKITQANTGAYGTLVADDGVTLSLANVSGSFLPGNNSVNYIRGQTGINPTLAEVSSVYNNGSQAMTANVSYVNLTTRAHISGISGTFLEDEVVTLTGNTSTSNAYVYFANTTQVWMTSFRGTTGTTITGTTSGATASIVSVSPSDFVYGSGNILYLENISPINKAAGQTETKKVIIEF